MNLSFLRSTLLVLLSACVVPIACDSKRSRGGDDECEEDSDCEEGEFCDDGECEVPLPSGVGGFGAGPSSSSGLGLSNGGSSSSGSPAGPASASSGGGGGGPCFTCAAYITDCALGFSPPPACSAPTFCRGSQEIALALQSCVCSYCAEVCSYTCSSQGSDSEDCAPCLQNVATTACSEVFGTCAGDA